MNFIMYFKHTGLTVSRNLKQPDCTKPPTVHAQLKPEWVDSKSGVLGNPVCKVKDYPSMGVSHRIAENMEIALTTGL